MKKILVILLVLAVSTGVFAQGDWSFNAEGMVMGAFNFDTNADSADMGKYPAATVGSQGYWQIPEWWSGTYGSANIGYSANDMIAFNLSFGTGEYTLNAHDYWGNGRGFSTGYPEIEGGVTLTRPNGVFSAALDIVRVLNVWRPNASGYFEWNALNKLYGNYKFLNDMLLIEVAYKYENDEEIWVSEDVGGGGLARRDGDHFSGWMKDDGLYSYLLADFTITDFRFGILIPGVFSMPAQYLTDYDDGIVVHPGILGETVFGLKYTNPMLEVAANLKLKDYQFYLGGKFFAGPVVAGISFAGILANDDTSTMSAGARITFDGGMFTAALAGSLWNDSVKATSESYTKIVVEPSFWFEVIPGSMGFNLGAGFYFESGKDAANNDLAMVTSWMVRPELFWSFSGSAPKDNWFSGVGVSYMIAQGPGATNQYNSAEDADYQSWYTPWYSNDVAASTNSLAISFKWHTW